MQINKTNLVTNRIDNSSKCLPIDRDIITKDKFSNDTDLPSVNNIIKHIFKDISSEQFSLESVLSQVRNKVPHFSRFLKENIDSYEKKISQGSSKTLIRANFNNNLATYVNNYAGAEIINLNSAPNQINLNNIDIKHTNILLVLVMVMILLADDDSNSILNQTKVVTKYKDVTSFLNDISNELISLTDPPPTQKDGTKINDLSTLVDLYKNHPEQLNEDTISKISGFMDKLKQQVDPDSGVSYWDEIGKDKDNQQQHTINNMFDSLFNNINSNLQTIGASSIDVFKKDDKGNYLISSDSITSTCQNINAGATASQNITAQQSQLLQLIEDNLNNHMQIGSVALSGYKSANDKIFSF